MKKIMTKTDMKGIHGGGRLKQRIAEHLRASRAVVSMSTAGVAAVGGWGAVVEGGEDRLVSGAVIGSRLKCWNAGQVVTLVWGADIV